MKTQYVKGYKRTMKPQTEQANIIMPVLLLGAIVLFGIVFWKVTVLIGFGSLSTYAIRQAI